MKTKNIYSLPLSPYDLQAALSDSRAHKIGSRLEHAVDFPLSVGTPIMAALDGEIVEVYTDSQEGGTTDEFRQNYFKYTNRIIIKHTNGEYSKYSHLDYKSEKVQAGQLVKQGEVIALSGNTGITTAPHLHFHVMEYNNDDPKDYQTLEIVWDKPLIIARR